MDAKSIPVSPVPLFFLFFLFYKTGVLAFSSYQWSTRSCLLSEKAVQFRAHYFDCAQCDYLNTALYRLFELVPVVCVRRAVVAFYEIHSFLGKFELSSRH